MKLFNARRRGAVREVGQRAPWSRVELERAVRQRLDDLWDSGTQRSRAETAGFLLAEIDPILQRWIDEEK